MKENDVFFAKEYKFDNPLITEIDYTMDSCFKNCHKVFFPKIKYECTYGIKLKNITNNEIFILTIIGKSMKLFELNEKLKSFWRKWFYILSKIRINNRRLFKSIRYKNTLSFKISYTYNAWTNF